MTKIATTCPYCGVGCGVSATLTSGLPNSHTPSGEKPSSDDPSCDIEGLSNHPANSGKLCSKGSALGETVSLEGRALYPQVQGERSTWSHALDTVADTFASTIQQHGPASVALYVSGQLLTEDYYVANKLMKGFIGTANIDTNSRLCMSSAVAGYKRAFGSDTVPGCYDDLEMADVVVFTGSNFAWCHPILFQRVLKARQSGTRKRIVVLDPRRTATAEQADLHLPLKPGTDVLLYNGLLQYLAQHGHADSTYIEQYCAAQSIDDSLAAAAEAADTAWVAEQCGLSEQDLLAFYALFAENEKVTTVFSMGVNQSSSGTDKVNAIINCHLYTGKIGKPGATPFSITGQPNAMGGREVGGLANMLAAHMALENPDHRQVVKTFWDSPHIADKPGLTAVDLFDAIHAGQIKAVWIMATNPAVSLPNAAKVNEALAGCDFVVVSDCIADTDTTRHADVLLPAAAWGEKDGTVTNSERRISRQRAFMARPAEVKPDWWIISQVAQRMGYGGAFQYQAPHEIFAEHAQLSGYQNTGQRDFNISGLLDVQGNISREQYDSMQPQQWPMIPNADSHDSQRFFAEGGFYTPDKLARMVAVTWRAPRHACTDEYPLVLNSGRVRDHWHTMTRTGKSARLSSHIVEPFLAVHPDDAGKYGLVDQQLAAVNSSWGTATLRVKVTEEQQPGQVFAPIHWSDRYSSAAAIGHVVNPAVDAISGEPEFKATPVTLTAINPALYGFVLSRQSLAHVLRELPTIAYWVEIKGDQFFRYEIALADTAQYSTVLNALMSVDDETQVLRYVDASTDTYRAAHVVSGQLLSCVYLSASGAASLPERGWLSGLFEEEKIDDLSRAALLLGESPDPAADTGPLVCSCFGVGKNTICQAIAEHKLTTTQAIGDHLKAGTNCGSCVPELSKLLTAN